MKIEPVDEDDFDLIFYTYELFDKVNNSYDYQFSIPDDAYRNCESDYAIDLVDIVIWGRMI